MFRLIDSALKDSHHNPQNWFLLIALTLIWGSSYILIKKGLTGFTPLELASLRITVSFVCGMPLLYKAFKTIPREKYFTVLQIGLFGSGLPAFLFALSMTHSGSAVNGILNSLSPVWTLIVGYYIFKLRISSQKVFGVIVGFMGALALVLGKGGNFEVDALYSFLPVVATFCYGLSTNISKQKLQNMSPLYTTAMAMLFIGIPASTILMFTDAPAKIISGEVWPQFLGIVALSVFGTFIAWVLFYRLIQRTDALFGAGVTYLIPLVAIAWGLFDGEMLTVAQVLGLALILAGVALISKKQTA